MKNFVISVVVLFAVAITVADAIKCYVCIGNGEDCAKDKLEADKAKYVLSCTESMDTCKRYWTKNAEGKTTVINSCTNKTQCDGSKKACDDDTEDGRQCTVSCCQTDECNAGSPSMKCFSCTGTEDECAKDKLEVDKAKYVVTCPSSSDRCMKTWAKKDDETHVVNSCASKAVCDATKKKACDDYKGGESAVSCCDTDECNAGSAGLPTVAIKCTNDASTSVSFSVFLMAVSSVLGLV
ncbi:hypothetical protein ACROYT_G017990 [Oculina patagonica]